MNKSSNGTYANFLIMGNVLEVNVHPDIVLNQTVLNQVAMEKKAFMLTHDPLPELYDISNVKIVQLEGSMQLNPEADRIAVYTAHKEVDDVDRIREINGLERPSFQVFQDKDRAREWLNEI